MYIHAVKQTIKDYESQNNHLGRVLNLKTMYKLLFLAIEKALLLHFTIEKAQSRHLVENLLARLKYFRRISIRFDKLARHFKCDDLYCACYYLSEVKMRTRPNAIKFCLAGKIDMI